MLKVRGKSESNMYELKNQRLIMICTLNQVNPEK